MTDKKQSLQKLQVKESLCGIFNLTVVVAEATAAYVLYFSHTSTALDVVAAFLLLDSALRAARQFIVIR